MQASPLNVIRLAPAASPSRVISAIAREINAAFALSPKFMPSIMPAPMATMFLSEPPSSTPTTSALVYTRNIDDVSAARACVAIPLVRGGDDRRRRHPDCHLTRQVWAGQDTQSVKRVAAKLLGENLAHAPAAGTLQTFGRAQNDRLLRWACGPEFEDILPERSGRHADDDDLNVGDGLGHVGGHSEIVRERESCEAIHVLNGGVHALRRIPRARPHQRLRSGAREQKRKGRAPTRRPNHRRPPRLAIHACAPPPQFAVIVPQDAKMRLARRSFRRGIMAATPCRHLGKAAGSLFRQEQSRSGPKGYAPPHLSFVSRRRASAV